MNICVFCSCSPVCEQDCSVIRNLGHALGSEGHSLVFGAFGEGMMGAIADGFHDAGARIYGVAPKVLVDAGRKIHPGCTDIIETETLAERKTAMIALSDVIIAAPGGIGTLDEVFSVLAMDITKESDMPVIVFNMDGFFDNMYSMLAHMRKEGYIRQPLDSLLVFADSIEDVAQACRSTRA